MGQYYAKFENMATPWDILVCWRYTCTAVPWHLHETVAEQWLRLASIHEISFSKRVKIVKLVAPL
jgi:hypothetical protein